MPSKRQLLHEAINAHVEKKRLKNRSSKTIESAKWVLKRGANALEIAGLEMGIKAIGEREIRYLEKNVFGGTLYYRRWALSFWDGFLSAHGNDIVKRLDLEWPEQLRTTVDWLDEDEEQMVWNALLNYANPIEAIVIALELGMGYRRTEVMKQAQSKIWGRDIEALGKGRNGGKLRTLRLNELVKSAISNWQYERDCVIARARKKNQSVQVPDLLVINEKQGMLRGYSESGIDQIVRRFRARMEMLYARKFDFSNHTLRRTFGRRQWKLGTPIETISAMLGHESVEMTKRYLGLNLEDQDQPMKKQDEFVSSILGYPKKDISEGEPVRVVGPKRFGATTDTGLEQKYPKQDIRAFVFAKGYER